MTYGENKKAEYKVKRIKYNFDSTTFDLMYKEKGKMKKNIKNINIKLLGKHNVLNSAASLILCLNLGADLRLAKKSLRNFSESKEE